jgi:diguanylate cyclase (GGDEF)-like protein/PAS domain S-box-containing protein
MTSGAKIEPDPLQAQFDGIPVPCYTWLYDGAEFVLERANRAAYERADGYVKSLIGRRFAEVFPDRPDIGEDLMRTLRERRTVRREMGHRFGPAADVRRLDVSYVYVPPDRVMVHADDVTELRENEERLRAVFATLESGLLTTDLEGRVTDANPAACTILGLTGEQLLADREWWRALALRYEDGTPITPGDPRTPGMRSLGQGEPLRDVTMLVTRPDGNEVTVSANYQPLRGGADGRVKGLVISFTDVTESRRLQERVAHQALHDPLTGLPNRVLFQERLEQALARPLRARVAVLLVGIDRFRAVNDTHGHAAGDQVLVEAATRLQWALDVSQPLARFGGDEFAVLAELRDEREAAALAQQLSAALERPFAPGIHLTAAIGIAVEDLARGGADLVQGADAALQRAKARGGGAYEIFDRAMGGRLRDRLKIEEGLRHALERDELRLVYQPIVDLETNGAVAVEALVRWQHPTEGLLAPGRFLPVAEQHGRLISAIGDWVLRRACTEAGRWPAGVRVSINVTARDLGEEGYPERVERTLLAAGVASDRIALEITETTAMQSGEAAVAGLEALAALGLQVYLDDFGTGYSSLTRIARLPLTGIKLDRGFVARAVGERDRRIIEAALSIGRAAELGVVAEGVETRDQLELLRASGCRYVQGYLLGRPAPPEQVVFHLTG